MGQDTLHWFVSNDNIWEVEDLVYCL